MLPHCCSSCPGRVSLQLPGHSPLQSDTQACVTVARSPASVILCMITLSLWDIYRHALCAVPHDMRLNCHNYTNQLQVSVVHLCSIRGMSLLIKLLSLNLIIFSLCPPPVNWPLWVRYAPSNQFVGGFALWIKDSLCACTSLFPPSKQDI